MPGTLLTMLNILTLCICPISLSGRHNYLVPFYKLRNREVKFLTKVHTASRWQSQVLKAGTIQTSALNHPIIL